MSVRGQGKGVVRDKAIVCIQGAQFFTVFEITLEAWIGRGKAESSYDSIIIFQVKVSEVVRLFTVGQDQWRWI